MHSPAWVGVGKREFLLIKERDPSQIQISWRSPANRHTVGDVLAGWPPSRYNVSQQRVLPAPLLPPFPCSSPVDTPLPQRGHFSHWKGRSVFRSLQSLAPSTKPLIRISVLQTFSPNRTDTQHRLLHRDLQILSHEPPSSKHLPFTNIPVAHTRSWVHVLPISLCYHSRLPRGVGQSLRTLLTFHY